MALNGISTLPSKELKQRAKLDLAASNRAAAGNPRSAYDITQLPTVYSGNGVVDNPNPDGLSIGRPWINDRSTLVDNFILENSSNLLTEDNTYILLED